MTNPTPTSVDDLLALYGDYIAGSIFKIVRTHSDHAHMAALLQEVALRAIARPASDRSAAQRGDYKTYLFCLIRTVVWEAGAPCDRP
jgi:hypothetical protein